MTPYVLYVNLGTIDKDLRRAAADLARTDQPVSYEKLAQVTCIPLTTLRRWVALREPVTT